MTYSLKRLAVSVALVAAALIGPGPGLRAEEPKAAPAPVPPPQRELWVPTEHLQSVLKKFPRAVMLTPEQYAALLRDSRAAAKPEAIEEAPPVAAAIREAAYEGELGNEVVRMTARYTVESFSDEWSEIPLALPRTRLAHIEVDEQAALRVAPPPQGENPRPVLAVRGKGRHTVTAEYHLPVLRSPAGNAIQITSPGVAAASLRLTLPDGAKLDSALPFVTGEEEPNVAHFVLPAVPGENFEIRWTARAIAAIPDAAVFQTCRYIYSIDSTRVQADLGLVLSSALADLPNTFTVSVPDGVRVLSVEGSELLRWTRVGENGALSVVLVSGKRQAADLRILAEADVPDATDSDVTLGLPIAEIDGVHRSSGTMALLGSDDVRVKNIATGPLTVAAPEALDAALRDHPHFVAGFSFPVTTLAPEITLSPVKERFNAQLDTRIELKRESIHLTRTLRLVPLEGRLFSTELTLPDGEELLAVTPALDGAPGFDWHRAGPNRVRLTWQQGLVAGDTPSLTVTTRRDPAGWFELGNAAMNLSFVNAILASAESVTGYVAVAFDESFRIETTTADGLEPRDGRTTPVTGTLAWFRLADYSLELSASRRDTEIEAAITAYALPLQNSLEIEGQLDLDIRYTPVSEVVVAIDPAIAAQLRFDSPLLAEKRLDTATGAWTLAFHDEQIGFRRLRFRMSLPFETEEASDTSGQKRFAVRAPVLSLPGSKRLAGHWIVEANTDTELSFEANGLDAIDSLRVPLVEGYEPRHRIIAAFQYRGDAYDLQIAGTRHAPEEIVTTVVDSLRIDTVASTDGADRHQAVLQLRTSGEQFLEIGLPKDAVLWTLTVDGAAVKPVRAEPNTLRVQLPAREGAGAAAVTMKLVYQTPGKKWGGSGGETLDPIRLADRIPVIRSQWLLHLPDGFDYQRFRSNLREEFQIVDRTLLGQVWEERDRFLPDMPAGGYAYAKDAAATEAAENYRKPMSLTESAPTAMSATVADFETDDAIGRQNDKLKSIIIPNVEFVDMPLADALKFIETRSRELDPEGQGITISTTSLFGGQGFGEINPSVASATITLKLTNVPVIEALRYTLALANLKYRVEPDAIVALPLSTPDSDLITNVYNVPPNFLSAESQRTGSGPSDPFAPGDSSAEPTTPTARPVAKEVLESYGITFGPGTSAVFNPETSQLIVRNTQDQMELVEAVTESIRSAPDPMLSIVPTNEPQSVDANGMVVQRFQVPADFLAYRERAQSRAGGGAADPFAAAPVDAFAAPAAPGEPMDSREAARQKAQEMLAQLGVQFEGGANVEVDAERGEIVVRNTREEIRKLNEQVAAPGQAGAMQAEGQVPQLGDMPVAGRLFDERGLNEQAGGQVMEFVDSESGERMVLDALGQPGANSGLVRGGAVFGSGGTVGQGMEDPFGGVAGGMINIGGGFQGQDGSMADFQQLPIDSLQLDNVPLALACEQLETRAREAAAAQPQPQNDAGGFSATRNLNIALDADGETAGKRVSLSLQNTTLAEALIRLTESTGTEYRVTAGGVVIAQPSAVPAEQLQTLVLELPNAAFETPDGNGGTRRLSARGVLTDAGIEFPRGTSAAYNFSTRRLAIRHIPESLEVVRSHFSGYLAETPANTPFAQQGKTAFERGFLGGANNLKGFDFKNAGLIPIDFTLPESGRSYVFSGLYAPEPIRFRYVNWERQVRFAWVWMLVGGLAFWFGAAKRTGRPILIGILGVIALTFLPLIISKSLLGFCNSLLIGWGAAALLWILWRLCDRASRPRSRQAGPIAETAESTL